MEQTIEQLQAQIDLAEEELQDMLDLRQYDQADIDEQKEYLDRLIFKLHQLKMFNAEEPRINSGDSRDAGYYIPHEDSSRGEA